MCSSDLFPSHDSGAGIVVKDDEAYTAIIGVLARINRDNTWFIKAWNTVVERVKFANEEVNRVGIVAPGTRALLSMFGGTDHSFNITDRARKQQHTAIATLLAQQFTKDKSLQVQLIAHLSNAKNAFIMEFIADHLMDGYFQESRKYLDRRRLPDVGRELQTDQEQIVDLHNNTESPQSVWSIHAIPFLQGLGAEVVTVFDVEPLPDTKLDSVRQAALRDLELRRVVTLVNNLRVS